MAKRLLTLRIDEGLLGRVDERRGLLGQTRTLFVSRALEAALGGPVPGDTRSVSSPRGSGHVKETAPTEDLASPQGSVTPREHQAVANIAESSVMARKTALERQARLNKAKGS